MSNEPSWAMEVLNDDPWPTFKAVMGDLVPGLDPERWNIWTHIRALAKEYQQLKVFPDAPLADLEGIAMIALGAYHGTVVNGVWCEWCDHETARQKLLKRYGWLPNLSKPQYRV